MLLSLLLAVGGSATASASTIEFNLHYTLGPVVGTFGSGQTLSGVGTFFNNTPIVVDVGDTLIFNILFDQTLQVFDFGNPTLEYFSFGLNTAPGSPGFSGTWVSSIEAVGSRGNIWSGPITIGWQGSGAGFGWGGQGVNVTDTVGTFTGIRWTTQLTSASEGVPMTLTAFTGVQMGAEGIRVLPVPELSSLRLLVVGTVLTTVVRIGSQRVNRDHDQVG
jgi:hypothetical protein